MRKTVKKIICISLTASMIACTFCGCAGGKADEALNDTVKEATETADAKDEDDNSQEADELSTYVFLDSMGTLKKVYINADEKKENITNMDNPVDISIEYILDGEKLEAESIYGLSGHLKVKYSFKNKTKAPLIAAAAILLDNEICKNVEIENGKVMDKGGNTFVLGYALPGMGDRFDWDALGIDNMLPDSFTWEADVTNYSQEMSVAAVIPYKNDDLNEKLCGKGESINDSVKDLISGVEKINGGAGALSEGINKLKDGTVTLKDGLEQEDDAIGKLNGGGSELYKGVVSADKGASEIHNGINKLKKAYEGDAGLIKGAKDLADGAESCEAGVEVLAESMKQTPQAVSGSINQIMSSVTSLTGIKTVDELNKMVTGIENAIIENESAVPVSQILAKATGGKITSYKVYQKLVSANNSIAALTQTKQAMEKSISEKSESIKALTGGMSQLSKGAGKLKSGINEMYSGTKDLQDGCGELSKGTKKLKGGAKELSTGLSELDKASGDIILGIKKLNNAAGKLSKGAVKLSDGTGEMEGRTEEFNDTIDVLTDTFDAIADLLDEGSKYEGQQIIYRIDGINKGDE